MPKQGEVTPGRSAEGFGNPFWDEKGERKANRMKKGIGKLFRSPALLVIAVVVMMAAATLAYAHWSGTTPISGDVQTGYIGMGFYDASTNDDGMENDWDGGDWGGPDDAYDHWFYECGWDDNTQEPIYCDDSSADPMMPGADPERYAKDVARCTANPHGENELYFSVENGYPSYYCTVAVM